MLKPENYTLDMRSFTDFEGPPLTLRQRARELYYTLVVRPQLKLLDLSRYQAGEVTNIKAIKEAGYIGVILQATYGLYVDSSFRVFWPMFLDEGFAVITYHLFWATVSGTDQAHKHLETVYPLWQAQGLKFPACNDIEVRDDVAVPVRQTRAFDWRFEVQKETRPGTYSSYSLWDELMGGIPLGPQLGWCAAWNPYEEFTLPRGWTREQTLLRQIGVSRKHAWVEPVPGMAGDVDVNVFYGTLEDLYNLADSAPPPEPEPEDDMTKQDILNHIAAIRADLAEDVDELDELAAEVEALPEGTTPPPPPPAPVPTTRKFKITRDKSLAHFYKSTNANGKPIMTIYDAPRYIYGPDKNVAPNINSGPTAMITMASPIGADGSNPGPWYVISDKRGKNNEVLFIDSRDGVIIT